jgi:murein L,D-transpeptidase YcbB/YkuD
MHMIRNENLYFNLLIAVIISLFYGCTPKGFNKDLSDNLSNNIKAFSQKKPSPEGVTVNNPSIISELYEKGGNFLSAKWNSREKIDQMISAIKNSSREGLNPDDYHLSDITKLTEKIAISKIVEVKDVARLELLLTDSFLLLASHLASGKTDPLTIYPEWDISRRNEGQVWNKFIDSTLKSDNIIGTLQNLTPRHPEYYNLKKALEKYRQIEEKGGWERFTPHLPKLEIGMRYPDVSLLRKRLTVTQGDIEFTPGNEDLFDKSLLDQVLLFQRRNCLNADGIVGNSTIDALNIPVNDRIETLEANLERWRWIDDDLGKLYIKVNIANFKLEVIQNEKQVFQSPVIVGLPFNQTPVFSSMLKYLVLNPDWVIPPDILKKEIIPDIIKNPAYLTKNNMKVLRVDGTEVDPSSIIWNRINAESFPYIIRQEPGPGNALGRIAFIFPNKYFVYIHDTPYPYLFLQNDRAFSHGCIRINKAFELAEYILKNHHTRDSIDIHSAIDQGIKLIIMLQSPIPVHILYLTVWADDEGTAYFTRDIYNRDIRLINALDQFPPVPDD